MKPTDRELDMALRLIAYSAPCKFCNGRGTFHAPNGQIQFCQVCDSTGKEIFAPPANWIQKTWRLWHASWKIMAFVCVVTSFVTAAIWYALTMVWGPKP